MLRGTGAGDRGPAAYYAPPIAPSFFAAFKAGHGDVGLLLQDRGAPTREQRFAEDLRRRYPDVKIRDASPILRAMREIKSDAELALIQRPVEVTVDAQKAAMARVLTATHEYEMQATIEYEYTFRNLGACCPAFPSIVAAGRNARRSITRRTTIPSSAAACRSPTSAPGSRVTPPTSHAPIPPAARSRARSGRSTTSCSRRRHEALPLMRPGRKFIEIHERAQEVVGRELLKPGLVTKNVREADGRGEAVEWVRARP